MQSTVCALRNLPAPAKINWFLHVTGRRRDGYHLLETVFQFIDVCDYIDLDVTHDMSITRTNLLAGVAPNDDITVKAALALQRETGVKLGAKIGLTKLIPMGGGLGGGSSDAATVLLGLNLLWSCGLSRDRLAQIGLRLGADVPVFVRGHSAYATGVGEKLQKLVLPVFPIVLVTPPVQVPTAAVFGRPELTRNTEPLTIVGFTKELSALPGRNDLEPVAASHFLPVKAAIGGLRQIMKGLNSDSNLVRMSGSGACVFVKCSDLAQAQLVAQQARQMQLGAVQVTQTLAQHPLKTSFKSL
jgi:4-diphosphocytidyl-2-C-methyl-D-erythritol kinase